MTGTSISFTPVISEQLAAAIPTDHLDALKAFTIAGAAKLSLSRDNHPHELHVKINSPGIMIESPQGSFPEALFEPAGQLRSALQSLSPCPELPPTTILIRFGERPSLLLEHEGALPQTLALTTETLAQLQTPKQEILRPPSQEYVLEQTGDWQSSELVARFLESFVRASLQDLAATAQAEALGISPTMEIRFVSDPSFEFPRTSSFGPTSEAIISPSENGKFTVEKSNGSIFSHNSDRFVAHLKEQASGPYSVALLFIADPDHTGDAHVAKRVLFVTRGPSESF